MHYSHDQIERAKRIAEDIATAAALKALETLSLGGSPLQEAQAAPAGRKRKRDENEEVQTTDSEGETKKGIKPTKRVRFAPEKENTIHII